MVAMREGDAAEWLSRALSEPHARGQASGRVMPG